MAGHLKYNKWRLFVNTKIHLPQKIELWEKRLGNEYELTLTSEIDYPTNDQVQQVIKHIGF